MTQGDCFEHEEDGNDLFSAQPDWRVLPARLFSDYTRRPFAECLVCGARLAEGSVFQVQKTFRHGECVFEMAICYSCSQQMFREYSRESQEAILQFRSQARHGPVDGDSCAYCGEGPDGLSAFTILGLCRRQALLAPEEIVCQRCEEGLQQQLSQKTRDIHGDFVADHFPGIPAEFDLSPTRYA